MSNLKKLVSKVKGSGSIGIGIGIILLSAIVLLAVGSIGGIILIWGLNLMGFAIPYTLKTIFGALVVILTLRPTSFGSSKEK